MYSPLRRRILGWLAAIAFSEKLSVEAVLPHSHGDDQEVIPTLASPNVALGLVRIINTLEVEYKVRTSYYGTTRDLDESGLLTKVFETIRTRNQATRMDAYPEVNTEGKEILPGWSLDLFMPPERDKYLLTIRPRPESGYDAFGTDQQGVIYRGKPLATAVWPDTFTPASELAVIDLQPLQPNRGRQQTTWSRLGSVVRGVAFFSVATEQTPDICSCCSCPSNCCRSSPDIGCCNSGFGGGCAWCCCSSTCSNCNLSCNYCCCASCYGC